MAWDPVWEKIYKSRSWGMYPPEELIRFIATNYYSINNRKKIKILEVGCGTGANLWYLAREGFSVYGIDGSRIAIKLLKQRFKKENLTGQFIIGEINNLPWDTGEFDCVIDNNCLSCNTEKDTQQIINEIHRVLKNKGKHFSKSLAKGCWGKNTGIKIDHSSRSHIRIGPCKGMGIVRFATVYDIKTLYQNFTNLKIELSEHTYNNRTNKIRNLIISCQK